MQKEKYPTPKPPKLRIKNCFYTNIQIYVIVQFILSID